MHKKLYKSSSNRMLAGVCAGIAEYFNIDATIIRVAFALVSVLAASVPGVLIYIICAIIIPDEPDSVDTNAYYHEDSN